jgi:hypothetical protein
MADATPVASYSERVREQQSAWLKLTHRQRLDWLWKAKLFAARALEAAKARKKTSG